MMWLLALLAALLQAPSPAQPTPQDAVTRAGAVLAAIGAGEFDEVEAQFTDEMKAALPPGRLAATWKTLLTQVGALEQCASEPRVVPIADKRMVIIACEFQNAAIDIQFAFDRAGRISGMTMRPAAKAPLAYMLPSYAAPSSFIEREVTIGSGQWALPGTLTIPANGGPWPAVVLVHGSGPNDRDETVGGSKPFKDLAVGLASRGIAVLRYDKRSRVHGARQPMPTAFTVKEEVVDDALEAVRTARAQPAIDRERVFVLGHSLGAMLIPRIGTADPAIAGLIALAAPARPIEEAIVAQTRYLAGADGTISPEEQRAIEQAAEVAEAVRALTPEDATAGRTIFNAPAAYWLDLRGYDPPAAATLVKHPMLILHGGRDYQVTSEEFSRWRDALGSRPDVAFRNYPALNHLFIAGTGPSLPAEYNVPGHVAEDVIRDIAAWIRESDTTR